MKMVEIFKTDIETELEAEVICKKLGGLLSKAQINFDLEDCDKILRVSAIYVRIPDVVTMLNEMG